MNKLAPLIAVLDTPDNRAKDSTSQVPLRAEDEIVPDILIENKEDLKKQQTITSQSEPSEQPIAEERGQIETHAAFKGLSIPGEKN